MGRRQLTEKSPLTPTAEENNYVGTCSTRRLLTIVELIVFTTSVSLSALQITVQNYYIHRVCLHQLETEKNASFICDNLIEYYSNEVLVETEASKLASFRLWLEAGPPIFFGLVWGQLNDRIGSKVPLVLPMIGFALYSTLFLLTSFIQKLPPGLLLLVSIPLGCLGGGVAYSVSGYKYIVSTSTPEERSFRMGMMDVSLQLGQPLGTIFGSLVFTFGGFKFVFLSTLMLQLVAISAVVFLLQNNEPQKPNRTEPSSSPTNQNEGGSIFSWSTVRNTISSLFKRRAYRKQVLLLTAINSLQVFSVTSTNTISFFYARLTFQWEQSQFSTFTTVNGLAMAIAVGITGYVMFKIYRVSPVRVGLAASVLCIISALIWTFSNTPIMFYIGGVTQFPTYLISVVVRSILSFLVPESEIGKILSCVGTLESVMPLIGGPLANALYVSTITTFPSAVFLISAILYVIVFVAFCFLQKMAEGIISNEQ